MEVSNEPRIEKKIDFKVLIIDDEPMARGMINQFLKDYPFETVLFGDASEALEYIKNRKDPFDFIFVDYIMPKMNGVEFTKILKSDPLYQKVPIIMLTSKGDTESTSEGIASGVLHYVKKPIVKSVLLSIVDSVTAQIQRQRELDQIIHKFDAGFKGLKSANFTLKTLEHAEKVGQFLSKFFPAPNKVLESIQGLLINAIEHGNFNVQYKKKNEVFDLQEWRSEVLKKQHLPENKNKTIRVALRKNKEQTSLTIEDDGEGFDWKNYIKKESASKIANVYARIFDKIEYNSKGNKVKVSIYNNSTNDYSE